MKKFTITISMAALLLSGVAGCGDVEQTNDVGANNHQTNQRITNQGTGQMYQGSSEQGQRGYNYHEEYDGETVRQIVNRVERIDGVEEARVLIHEDQVVVAATVTNDEAAIREEVEAAVYPFVYDRNVTVVTDEVMVGRVREMDNQLRQGAAINEVDNNFNEILADVDRAVQDSIDPDR